MEHVVAFTATNRPDYLRQTLDSWRKVRGIEQTHLIFRCEPGFPEVVDICASADFGGALSVTVNEQVLGPLTNPWYAMEDGWHWADKHGLDFVIIAEDDTPVSTDVLEYYSWCQRYKNDPEVLIAGAFQHEAQGGYADVVRSEKFICWIWGTWRDNWFEYLRNDWDHDYTYKGWDWRIAEHWMQQLGFRTVAPAMSRSQDIGIFGGAHARPEDFPAHVSRCFTPDIPPQDYREI